MTSPILPTSTDMSPYINAICGGVSIVPVFPLFVCKSKLQCGEKKMKGIHFRACLLGALKASPIISTQILIQEFVERKIKEKLVLDKSTPLSLFLSTLFVGSASAPYLLVFNGLSMGQSPIESLRSLNLKKISILTVREVSFLAAIPISEPLSLSMKKYLGDYKTVNYATAFFTGVIASIVGHPADTMVTCLQGKIPVEMKNVMRGWKTRALAIGLFSVLMMGLKDFSQNTKIS